MEPVPPCQAIDDNDDKEQEKADTLFLRQMFGEAIAMKEESDRLKLGYMEEIVR